LARRPPEAPNGIAIIGLGDEPDRQPT